MGLLMKVFYMRSLSVKNQHISEIFIDQLNKFKILEKMFLIFKNYYLVNQYKKMVIAPPKQKMSDKKM